LMAGDQRIHIWSPASAAYKDVFVQDWQVKYSGNPILKEENLALTPMVFVMWEERYQSFIQKYKEVTFATIGQALNETGGWEAKTASSWNIFALPTSFLIDKEGRLIAMDLEGKELEKTLKDMLED